MTHHATPSRAPRRAYTAMLHASLDRPRILVLCAASVLTMAAAAADSTWTRIASEDQPFSVSGSQTVRYGAGSSWITKTVSGSAVCSNTFFGGDPLYGTTKACDVASTATTSPTWTQVASEGQSFGVSGTQDVRYGAGAYWITRSVSGSGQCTNEFFGGDPIFGTVKQCQVAAGGSNPTPPPPSTSTGQICTPPIDAANTASVAASVGNGTPQSCTEAALRSAVASQSTVTFNCGADPVTIGISQTIDIPTDRNTVIDGGNKVTLDGGGTTRILSMVRPNYRTNTNGLTLQHITLANGRAIGTAYVAPDPSNASCAYGYADGAGGAILVRDAALRVIDATFRNNVAATPGPDVGGGAIFAAGSLEVTVIGSTFTGNSGSNAGAVGLLQTNGRFYNSVFTDNVANGSGGNFAGGAASGCPGIGHPGQGGAGGNAGAIGVDGADDTDLIVCGTRFAGNRANEFGGALFRTANVSPRRTSIDRALFQDNRARQGGGVFLMNSNPLDILASAFSGNIANGGGAGQLVNSKLNLVNSSFFSNQASAGIGGALLVGGMDSASVVRNATFSNNKSPGGPGLFSAAIGGTIGFPIVNTVFADNITNDAWSPMQCGFTPTSGAYNLQWPRNHVIGGAPDVDCVNGIVFADPLLGAPGNNGGPTPTAVPATTSPLRGAGHDCPATDQRGVARNSAQCTVGAVE